MLISVRFVLISSCLFLIKLGHYLISHIIVLIKFKPDAFPNDLIKKLTLELQSSTEVLIISPFILIPPTFLLIILSIVLIKTPTTKKHARNLTSSTPRFYTLSIIIAIGRYVGLNMPSLHLL